MTNLFSADYLFDGKKIIENGYVEFENEKIVYVGQAQNRPSFKHYSGLLMPGFINTHCHLELSHLFSKVPTGTGLLPFLRAVVQQRDVDEQEIQNSIKIQDKLMWENGIQAVGDISNKADTAETKATSPISYYTFVEMFDLMQEGFTENSYLQYEEVYKLFNEENGNNKSAVPHAPYTVTPGLFSKINQLNSSESTVSIHNQETVHEDLYFLDKSGGFSQFYSDIGISDKAFDATGTKSIYYAMKHMDSAPKTLFVHNTQSLKQNIQDALAWNPRSFWATCANANLYIENQLPDYKAFIDCNAKLTIGTDSLSSNWQLSVLEELKTIQKFNSYLPIETLLQWSTINGAQALSMDYKLGSLEVGKSPGLIFLSEFDGKTLQNCEVTRVL